ATVVGTAEASPRGSPSGTIDRVVAPGPLTLGPVRQKELPDMGWFTKADDQFVEKAVDDTRRASAIADLNTRRVLLLVCLLLFVVGAVLAGIGGGTGFGVGGAVFVAIYTSIVFKMESDLRLLKVIDRLRKEGRLPPA